MLHHVGTDVTGRPVYTTLGYWADAFALAATHVKINGPISLLWNGVPVPVFPGQAPMEWWIDCCLRTEAMRVGGWPRQIAPFMCEVDPFKVTPLPPEPEEAQPEGEDA